MQDAVHLCYEVAAVNVRYAIAQRIALRPSVASHVRPHRPSPSDPNAALSVPIAFALLPPNRVRPEELHLAGSLSSALAQEARGEGAATAARLAFGASLAL